MGWNTFLANLQNHFHGDQEILYLLQGLKFHFATDSHFLYVSHHQMFTILDSHKSQRVTATGEKQHEGLNMKRYLNGTYHVSRQY